MRLQRVVWRSVVGVGLLFTAVTAHGAIGDQLDEFIASDGAAGDFFGNSVSISGTTAIVGASQDDDACTAPMPACDSGSAYLIDTTTGLELFKLNASDGVQADRFGHSVAISGTTAIVGAILDDDNGNNSGSAYLFSTVTGLELFKLLSSNGAAEDRFGASVGVSGTTAVVGQPGMSFGSNDPGYAFVFDTTTGLESFVLQASDGLVGDLFGNAVAISGTTAIVGAHFDDNIGGSEAGAAYLYNTTNGMELFKLLPGDGAAGDRFGQSVAISGTIALVGSVGDDDNGSSSGSAYLFDTTTGQELFKLTAHDGLFADSFGVSVAIEGTIAVVGAGSVDDNGAQSGAVYLFDVNTGQFLAKVFPSDPAASDFYGSTVSISGIHVIVGAAQHDDLAVDAGAAYLFDASGDPPCPSDVNGDGVIDTADLGILIGLFGMPCP